MKYLLDKIIAIYQAIKKYCSYIKYFLLMKTNSAYQN